MTVVEAKRLIFLHGLEGSSQGVKATLLREIFPQTARGSRLIIPDFRGSLGERMNALNNILGNVTGWIIVGSSFGGLMGALFACQRPKQARKLVLLAPALIWPDFAAAPPAPINVPTTIFHGNRDEIIPADLVKELAEKVFLNLDFHLVDDDHGLYKTVHEIDWLDLLS
jgi:pimeloyl-ACP methyl ester carboxylesterase